jgi:hypothetical protein
LINIDLSDIDLSDDTQRQIIIARGSSKVGEYHAHTTMAMLADNKTIFCVWNIGHGGHAGPMARSDEAGLTCKLIDDVLPPNYVNFKSCQAAIVSPIRRAKSVCGFLLHAP